jgi:hypothetical protein
VFGTDGANFWAALRLPNDYLQRTKADNSSFVAGHCWVGDGEFDRDDPGLVSQDLHVRVYSNYSHEQETDKLCELALVDDGSFGLESACREVVKALKRLGADDGINVQLVASKPGEEKSVLRGMSREIIFRADLTTEPNYPAPRSLAAADGGSHSAALTWKKAAGSASRYDYVGQVLEYAAGATAPATPGTGTAVAIAGTAESKTVATGAGQFSFALWASYESRWPLTGVADSYSDRQTATVTVA